MRFSFGSDNAADKLLKQAEKYVQQGKYLAAIDEYLKVLEASPGDLTLLNTIGDLCVRAGRNDDAVRYFQRIADSYSTSNALPSAIAFYKKILKVAPQNADVSVKLGDLLCKQGLFHDARRHYAMAAEALRGGGDAQRALRIQQKIADIDPENVECRLVLADQYRQDGFPREAYQAYIQAGQELQRVHSYRQAVEVFKKALEVRPDSKVALGALVDCYGRLGEETEALRLLDGMIAAAPDDADLVSILGKIQLSGGRLADAEKTYARLATIDPTRPDAPLEVARHYIAADRYDDAIRIAESCTTTLVLRGLKKKVTAIYKEILRRDPTNVGVLKRLVEIYSRVGERRNLVATLNTLVEAASRRGMKEEATWALQQLVEIEPETTPFVVAATEADTARLPARQIASDEVFPEGFESVPALLEWTHGASDGPRADGSVATAGTGSLGDEIIPDRYDAFDGPARPTPPPAVAAIDDGDVSFPAASEYSMELADDLAAKHPEFREARIKLLEDLVADQPKYVVGRTKLKTLYQEAGMNHFAAEQCIELARLYEEQGERDRAKEWIAEAYTLYPSVEAFSATVSSAQPAAQPEDEFLKLDDMFTVKEFNKYFDREWRRAIRDNKPISMLKIEVDAVNDYFDTYGLLGGDYCLERVAAALESELLRPGDLISTHGGGVFLVLLPETPHEALEIVSERLRSRVEAMRMLHETSPVSPNVTVSIGAASAIAHVHYSSDALLAAADEALVRAKLEGGNRIVTAPLVTI